MPPRRPTNLEVDTDKTTAEEPRRSARLRTPSSALPKPSPQSPVASRKRARTVEHDGDPDDAMMDGAPQPGESPATEESSSEDEKGEKQRSTGKEVIKKIAKKPAKKSLPKSPKPTGSSKKRGNAADEVPWWQEMPPTPPPDERGSDDEDDLDGPGGADGVPMYKWTSWSRYGEDQSSITYLVDEGLAPDCRLRSESQLPIELVEEWQGKDLAPLEDELEKFDELIGRHKKGSHQTFRLLFVATYIGQPQGKTLIGGTTMLRGDKDRERYLYIGWKKHWCSLYGRKNAQTVINRACRGKKINSPFKESSTSRSASPQSSEGSSQPTGGSSRASSVISHELDSRLGRIERAVREMSEKMVDMSTPSRESTPSVTARSRKHTPARGAEQGDDDKREQRRKLLAQLEELDGPKPIPSIVVSR